MAKGKAIRITCEAAGVESLNDLVQFQGNLKLLRDRDRTKLKGEILKLGICEPFTVWKNEDGVVKVLNGHQRLEVLKEMVGSGQAKLSDIGGKENGVPVTYAQPKDDDEAAHMVLALASTYGRVNAPGLQEFQDSFGIGEKEFQESFSFPELDATDGPAASDEEKVEFTKKKKQVKCPGCGKVFDPKKHKHETGAKKGKKAAADLEDGEGAE